MSVKLARSGSLSEKRLNGIYWRTFVGFVNKDNGNTASAQETEERKMNRIQKREGSFEYMELTAKDNSLMQSESESCSSTDNSLSDLSKEEKSAPMYAVLDMNRRKEIQINDEIAIFDGSPIHRKHHAVSSMPTLDSPKCSPIMHADHMNTNGCVPSPIFHTGDRSKTLQNIDKDEALFSDLDDASYDDSYEYEERSNSASPDTVPWKEHCTSIQRWMLPALSDQLDDEFVTLPDTVPMQDYEYCHYVPTLEAIMEEDEEGDESYEDLKQKFPRGLYIDNADIRSSVSDDVGWHSTNDLSECSAQSQDDLFSITSTCGSLGSMKRFSTMENLSFDEGQDEESDGSSDELDRVDGDTAREEYLTRDVSDIALEGDESQNDPVETLPELSVNLFPEARGEEEAKSEEISEQVQEKKNPSPVKEVQNILEQSDISSQSTPSPRKLDSSREAIPASSVQSLLESDYASLSDRGESPSIECRSSPEEQNSETVDQLPPVVSISYTTPQQSIEDIQSEPVLESVSSDMKSDDYDEPRSRSELDLSDISPDLHFDAEDIPKIVVLFAQQELAKQRLKSQTEDGANEDIIQNRKRSSTIESDGLHDSAYSSREGIHRRLHEIKNNESRMSALSSSTPELSVMTEDALPYIPISYASEAAAKRKKKRRATMSAAESSNRRNAIRSLQSKALIGGSGLGSGFSTLKKKLSRKSIGNSLRRSQSEKPSVYYSSPDVSNPVSRQPDSPRRGKAKTQTELPPKVPGQRRGIRSVVSNILRRLTVRFASHNHHASGDDEKHTNDVIEVPTQSHLLQIAEESSLSDSASLSSSARDSTATPSTCNGDTPQRRVSSALAAPGRFDALEDFRERSQSVPVRPRFTPSPRKLETIGSSEVFQSARSVADSELDTTLYV